MLSSDYFIDESLKEILSTEKAVIDYEDKLISILEESKIEIQKEINAFYGKYASENKISYSEAKRRLTNSEHLSFNQQIELWLRESKKYNLSPEFQEYLRTLSKRVYLTRLEELYTNIQVVLEQIYSYQQEQLPDLMRTCFIFAYYDKYYSLARGLESEIRYTSVNMSAINEVILQKWEGENYSDRIWKDKTALTQTLGTVIPQSFSRGLNGNETGEEIAKKLDVSTNHGRTLARTEINRIANAATIRNYRAAGIKQYKYLATLDMRTSQICRSLDGKIFNVSDAKDHVNLPPMHPSCRSTTVAYFPGDKFKVSQRVAKDAEGNRVYVPSNMTQEQYIRKYVPKEQQEKMLKFLDKYSK